MKAALILDFDGTIAPTEHLVFEGWRRFFEPHGFVLELDRYATGIGRMGWTDGFDPWREAAALGLGEREIVRPAVRAIIAELLETMEPNPGVEPLLAAAARARVPLGIASSSDSAWVLGHLDRFGWREWFGSVRTADHGPGKPEPILYQMAVEDLGADPAVSWAIEDSGPGVAAAKAAGLHVVAVPHELTAAHDVSAADLIVDSLEGMTLERLGYLTAA